MKSKDRAFDDAFKALSGFSPFPWQQRLYERLVECDVPDAADIPTGLGKTAVIFIWLLAVASRLQRGLPLFVDRTRYLPRRLIYVVNRRTIVDRATDDAAHAAEAIAGGIGPLTAIKEALARTAGPGEALLTVSTLRGARADDRQWHVDPARPGIIVGTIDMIGSKLLFSGYGSSYKLRPWEAGLVGQDCLYVHDEAHLSPAFSALLRDVRKEQLRSLDARPIRILELSATQRGFSAEGRIELEPVDFEHPEIKRRVHASKRLAIEKAEDPIQKVAERMLALGAATPGRVVGFVRSPEDARRIAQALLHSGVPDAYLAVLTGTMRGHERDALVEMEAFQAFAAGSKRPPLQESRYLVATSAGEVGVDLDADHAVMDLTTLDGVIQRLGRVNRLGLGSATIELYAPEVGGKSRKPRRGGDTIDPADGADRLALTVEALRSLPRERDAFDASPAALRALAGHEEAFEPTPVLVPATDIHFDRWAMTSVRDALPGREAVAPFLHGVTRDAPETHVAWRGELDQFVGSSASLESWGEQCPLRTRELLRERTYRVVDALLKIHERIDDLTIAIVDRGTWTLEAVAALVSGQRDPRPRLMQKLAGRTIILPASAGGLSREGLLDARVRESALDVGEDPDNQRFRLLLERDNDAWRVAAVTGSTLDLTALAAVPEGLDDPDDIVDAIEQATKSGAVRFTLAEDDDGLARCVLAVFLRSRRELVELTSHVAPVDMELRVHLDRARDAAMALAGRSELDGLAHAVACAASLHDTGKGRLGWQRAVENPTPDGPKLFAKRKHGRFHNRFCPGYRHELGSLLDASRDAGLAGRDDLDLVLHLIASHHGRARPHFERRAFDVTRPRIDNERIAAETIDRFVVSQAKHGRWGLAWLEALHHAADVKGSLGEALLGEAPR